MQLLHEAARLAGSGDFSRLCKTVAASEQNCLIQLEDAAQSNQTPGPTEPKLISADSYTINGQATTVLHIEGKRKDGADYFSDFAVIRKDIRNLVSLTAIFWSGTRFVQPTSPTTPTATT
ncbi:hypothetical protein [Amycolatopsis sp. NPDC051372]|uniref:hypothetical protein n=1 Tax=Amycolatopsis sp. NPDC051372 TaxID=3155669 RepID=UPI00343A6554